MIATVKRLISIPRMTYQNFTPIEEWEIYFFEVQRQLEVIEDTILVTKPIFRLFIVITMCQIHLRDINKKK